MQQIEIIYPDDWHCHLRDGHALALTVPMAAKQFKRAIVMPNLQPPIAEVENATAYYQRIMAHVPSGANFKPLMTLYLKDNTTVDIIRAAAENAHVFACKLYPAGVTTNSQNGVENLTSLYPIFETMAKYQLPLLIHGEVNDPDVDVFDRERVFIDKHLQTIVKEFSNLKIVFEHITTIDAVDFVIDGPSTLAATITPQHLYYNRNALFLGGIKPHHYCLPVLKRKIHQEALIKAATSGNPKFFIGTDSAPHAKSQKESACGCAGIFSHHAAIEIYAHIFDKANALEKLEGFTSKFGADFYQLPYNQDKIILQKQDWTIVEEYPYQDEVIIPFLASQSLNWQRIS
jgi:dihydroorotase